MDSQHNKQSGSQHTYGLGPYKTTYGTPATGGLHNLPHFLQGSAASGS